MAALQNYRNIYFNTALVRVLTANALISGTVSIFYKAQDAIALVPASGVITVDQGSYTNPTYTWYTVVNEVQTLIAGQTTNQYTVTNTSFDTLVGTNNFVTYRVVVTQQGFPSKTLDYVIGLVREVDANLTSGMGVSITNDTHAFPSNDQGVVYTYLNSGTDIQVFEGGVELNYDGVGTNNSTYRITTQAIDIIPGAVSAVASDVVGVNFARFANHSGMPANKDIAIITYSIIGKTSNGTAFTIKKSQTFTKVKTTALNFLHITPPVLTKQAPDAATVGTYSTLTITGKKYEAGVTTDNIGFVTITKQGDTEVWPALATPQTFTPASNSSASRYVINLYNQATQAGAQKLDDETVDVVFKGATGDAGKVLRIEATSYTFNADAANVIPTTVITLTARKQNTTQTVSWTTTPGVTLRQTATAGSAAVTQGDVVYLHSSDFAANTAVRVTAQLTDGVVITDTCNITRVKDGSYAAEPILSNPVHYFPANSAGTVTTYASSGTTLRVFEFGQYRTITAVTAAVTNINSVTLGASQGVGTTTVTVPDYTSITSDSAQVTYTITYTRGNGASDQVTAVQAFAKNKQGLPGVSAATVDLSADSLFFFTPKNGGTITPATIQFSTVSFNLTVASRKWFVDGVEQAGQTASTFSLASFTPGQERLVRVELTGTVTGGGTITIGDQLTVYSFEEGSDALAAGLENENRTITCDVAGTPIAGQFPQTSKMLVARGSGIVTSGVAYSVLSQTNCVVSIDAGTGNITITSMSANTAEAVFRAAVTTGTQTTNLDKKLTLNKSFNGANAVTIKFDNGAVNLGSDANGVIDYTTSGANLYVSEGSTNFTYVTTTDPAANQFTVTTSATGITAGTIAASTSGTTRAIIGVASNLTAASVASVTYTIRVRRSDNSISTFTEIQTFNKTIVPQTVDINGYTTFGINTSGAVSPASATLTAVTTGISTPVYAWTVTGATPATGTGSSITVTPSNTTGPVVVTLSVTGANMPTAKTATITMPIAQRGAQGVEGTKTATVSIYQWTTVTTAPAVPTTNSSYNWTNSTFTVANPWSNTVPTSPGPGYYLWEVVATITATASTASTTIDWSALTPKIVSSTSKNSAVVYAYQRAASAPTTNPSGALTLTYSFASKTITSALQNSWTQTVPTGINPLYVTTATVVEGSTPGSGSIVAADWSTPVLLVQNGSDGVRGSINGAGLTYGIVSNTWADAKANRVVSNIANSQSLTTDLATTLGNRIGDTVTLSNSGFWIYTRGVFSASETYVPGDVVLNVALTIAMSAKTINSGTTFGDPVHWTLVKGNLDGTQAAWTSGTTYTTNKLVSGNLGNGTEAFISKIAHTATGTNIANNVFQGGSPWILTRGTYSTTVDYFTDDIVVSGTVAYICLQKNKNQPLTNTVYWRQYKTGVGTAATWTGSTAYVIGNRVNAANTNGVSQTWLCQYDHTSSTSFATDRDRVEFSETRYWSGTSWVSPGQVIDGNLLVKGTISGDKLIAGSVTVDSLSSGTGAAVANGGSFYLGLADTAVGYKSTIIVDQASNSDGWCIMARQFNTTAQASAIVGMSRSTGVGAGAVFINSADDGGGTLRTLTSASAAGYGLVSRYLRLQSTPGNNAYTPQNQAELSTAAYSANFRWYYDTADVNDPTGRNYFLKTLTELSTTSFAGKFTYYANTNGNGLGTATNQIELSNASYAILVNSGTSYLRDTTISGSLGVGTVASGTAGEIRATNNITAYYSDDRFKTRLGNIKDALNKVCSLNGFHYIANDLAKAYGYEQVPEVGVSAQEVQKILPEVVVPAPIDSKYLTIRYERLVPLLVEAIKELSQKVDELRSRLGE